MRIGELFAVAHGLACAGPHPCLLCGSPSAESYTLPDTFTTRDTLARPGSPFRCEGCRLAMAEVGDAVYPTGEVYRFAKAYRRMCSWVVTTSGATAYTKAHLDDLRAVCLTPPVPPFAVSIAVSGQKQVLYRAVVCRDSASPTVTLEGERIDYRPAELVDRLDLVGRVCAATGKPALVEPPGPPVAFRLCERYAGGEGLYERWAMCWESPLSRLASFLTPNRENCQREYPSDWPIASDRHGGVPAAGGQTGRSDATNRSRRRGERQRGSNATLFGDV